jgi:hypothetical protein
LSTRKQFTWQLFHLLLNIVGNFLLKHRNIRNPQSAHHWCTIYYYKQERYSKIILLYQGQLLQLVHWSSIHTRYDHRNRWRLSGFFIVRTLLAPDLLDYIRYVYNNSIYDIIRIYNIVYIQLVGVLTYL